MSEASAPLAAPSARGFIRVDCLACKNPDVWFKCDQCGKSDHFAFDGTTVQCDCGASYSHGQCTCGETAPPDRLRFVDAAEGPLALADLEIAWGRVATLGVVLAVLVAIIALAVMG
jgi:hypothetical protein